MKFSEKAQNPETGLIGEVAGKCVDAIQKCGHKGVVIFIDSDGDNSCYVVGHANPRFLAEVSTQALMSLPPKVRNVVVLKHLELTCTTED
jgi:hypothetical protein